jgi:hypothetical protein
MDFALIGADELAGTFKRVAFNEAMKQLKNKKRKRAKALILDYLFKPLKIYNQFCFDEEDQERRYCWNYSKVDLDSGEQTHELPGLSIQGKEIQVPNLFLPFVFKSILETSKNENLTSEERYHLKKNFGELEKLTKEIRLKKETMESLRKVITLIRTEIGEENESTE